MPAFLVGGQHFSLVEAPPEADASLTSDAAAPFLSRGTASSLPSMSHAPGTQSINSPVSFLCPCPSCMVGCERPPPTRPPPLAKEKITGVVSMLRSLAPPLPTHSPTHSPFPSVPQAPGSPGGKKDDLSFGDGGIDEMGILNSTPHTGLTTAQARDLMEKYGPNALPEKKINPFLLFLSYL